MSEENTEKLIELVRERRLIYDLSDEDYKNRDKKAKAWLEIATNMGSGDSKVWIAKWKSLRDNFNKYKKSNESSGHAYKKYKSWPWAEQMRFLDDFNYRRLTENNSFSQANNTHTEDSTINEHNSTHSKVFATEPSEQINKRIKTSAEPSDSEILEYLRNEQETEMDAVDLLFSSYAQTLKTFSPRMQSIMKLKVASLFARYELQVADESDASALQVAPAPGSVSQRSSSASYSESPPSPHDDI